MNSMMDDNMMHFSKHGVIGRPQRELREIKRPKRALINGTKSREEEDQGQNKIGLIN